MFRPVILQVDQPPSCSKLSPKQTIQNKTSHSASLRMACSYLSSYPLSITDTNTNKSFQLTAIEGQGQRRDVIFMPLHCMAVWCFSLPQFGSCASKFSGSKTAKMATSLITPLLAYPFSPAAEDKITFTSHFLLTGGIKMPLPRRGV